MTTDKNHPLVSIGIPTYNRPAELQQVLKCLTAQTYKNLEIIVSDNASKDSSTQEMVEKFIIDSKRIFRVSRKPTKEEYKRMALIVGLGIIIIGIIGLIIQLIFTLSGIVGAWKNDFSS